MYKSLYKGYAVRLHGKMQSCRLSDSTNIEKRRAEIMSRGLPKQKPIQGVKQIVLIASGKGGVGKSTVAINLAAALKTNQPEKEVGILDVDIFGPSIPLMMNLQGQPYLTKDNQMIPLVNYGIKCMSMGFLVDEKSPVIWRGLMVMSAMEKLLRQVYWDQLDYLIIDTPPGTGDTHLSLMQNIPISGAVLVTTPQLAALQVTRKGGVMFKKLNVPIVGIVQNMSNVVCPQCKHTYNVFGNGSLDLCQELEAGFLHNIPLDCSITECSDQGKPLVLSLPNSSQAIAYLSLAEKVLKFLQQTMKESSCPSLT